jgi:uracil-DNA glycosylase
MELETQAPDGMDKDQQLRGIGLNRRNADPPDGYHSIDEYHNGAYESEYVSPYTKSAKNVDAQVAIILQDWSSHDSLSGPFDPAVQRLGYTPTSPTNVNLIQLLKNHFDLSLDDVFATNLFPFIKPGGMTADIPARHMLLATKVFADPQIRVVRPKLVVCLGLSVFNTMRRFHGKTRVPNLTAGVNANFSDGHTEYWCQAHTGRLGFINREQHGHCAALRARLPAWRRWCRAKTSPRLPSDCQNHWRTGMTTPR